MPGEAGQVTVIVDFLVVNFDLRANGYEQTVYVSRYAVEFGGTGVDVEALIVGAGPPGWGREDV